MDLVSLSDDIEDAAAKARGIKQLLESTVCGANCRPLGREGLEILLAATEDLLGELETSAELVDAALNGTVNP